MDYTLLRINKSDKIASSKDRNEIELLRDGLKAYAENFPDEVEYIILEEE